ncbi:hypothetical protein PENSUB_1657 [Penicillium subrubescens]|jgi:hypothetical protein|uniref:Uncharacterized protein n=1 Tax=Penicillium subrubescens TaxID=1316194 RepID=A0A1Q5UJR3_9EURO|nr:hypothetical protein PENSUB_1657 [Penicillium subrubescens]
MTTKEDNLPKELEDAVDKKGKLTGGPSVMPPSLANLSEAGFAKVRHQAILKLDTRIMPCMVLMYIMNYLDRQNIAAAKLAQIEQDLKMTHVQYQTCVSILFVGYSASIILTQIKLPHC